MAYTIEGSFTVQAPMSLALEHFEAFVNNPAEGFILSRADKHQVSKGRKIEVERTAPDAFTVHTEIPGEQVIESRYTFRRAGKDSTEISYTAEGTVLGRPDIAAKTERLMSGRVMQSLTKRGVVRWGRQFAQYIDAQPGKTVG